MKIQNVNASMNIAALRTYQIRQATKTKVYLKDIPADVRAAVEVQISDEAKMLYELMVRDLRKSATEE